MLANIKPMFYEAPSPFSYEKRKPKLPFTFGAGNRVRTDDLNLGKVALYQLSYSRILEARPGVEPG
jgi:hypothetical protein